MQITINDVRFALHQALGEAFPLVDITSVESSPPLNKPYFLVHLLEFTQMQEYGGRYRRSFPFVIRYVVDEESVDAQYDKLEVQG